MNPIDKPLPPDFEALRAERERAHTEFMQKFADEHGVPLQSLTSSHRSNACYCACATHGPCEHRWDGPGYTSDDDCCWSATCSRCGTAAMSHDMRVLP